MWILLIEDESRLAASLRRGLQEEGHTVDVAVDGLSGEDLALENAYDVLIVDWRLPKKDGRSVVESVRAAGRQCPILMLTALGDVEHRIAGLDAGADDYLSKPFSFEELLARLRALSRRPPLAEHDQYLRVGPVELDSSRRSIRINDLMLTLRPKEFGLMELFMRHPGEVFSRTVIAERVWGDPFYVSDNALDVTISGLRQKLDEAVGGTGEGDGASLRIETIRGVGYRLEVREP